MPNCTGNCASASPKAGDSYILKGGDTWGAASLGIEWQWGGNSTSRIYIRADQTWFSGASWARPKFDCQNTECNSHFIQVDASGAYVTIDNLELTGIRQITGSIVGITTLANYTEAKDMYIHGWSHVAGAPDIGRDSDLVLMEVMVRCLGHPFTITWLMDQIPRRICLAVVMMPTKFTITSFDMCAMACAGIITTFMAIS